jgi:hypothetical protein
MSRYYGYYGDVWYLYLAILLRQNAKPKKVIKIGITNARDPMLRLTYKGEDEPHPILNYFPDIQLVKYKAFDTKEEAERAERKIMGMVKRQFNSPRFHNWREPDHISGITEMRIWDKEEFIFIDKNL